MLVEYTLPDAKAEGRAFYARSPGDRALRGNSLAATHIDSCFACRRRARPSPIGDSVVRGIMESIVNSTVQCRREIIGSAWRANMHRVLISAVGVLFFAIPARPAMYREFA
jgi:hypothetical protein